MAAVAAFNFNFYIGKYREDSYAIFSLEENRRKGEKRPSV